MIRLKVKEIARHKGFSQGELSRKANLDIDTVRQIYRDPYRDINITTLAKLAEALQVDASLLIESDPPLPKTLSE